jgi:hypothetical protein
MDNWLDLSPLFLNPWVVLGSARWHHFPTVENNHDFTGGVKARERLDVSENIQIFSSKIIMVYFKNIHI